MNFLTNLIPDILTCANDLIKKELDQHRPDLTGLLPKSAFEKFLLNHQYIANPDFFNSFSIWQVNFAIVKNWGGMMKKFTDSFSFLAQRVKVNPPG